MLEISKTDRICITGLPRSGKTIFCHYLCTLVEPNLYVIDPLSQYEEFGEIGDVLSGGKRWIPKQETPMELELIAKKFHAISNTVLIIEEAEQYIAQGKAMLPYTSSLIRMGRNWGIGIWATTRRIQDINKRFFDLAQRVFFFRCGFKSREYIADMIGKEYMYPQAVRRYNKTGYCITTLPPFAYLHFDLENETAQVQRLNLRGRGMGQVEDISKKSEVGRETVKKIAEQPQEEPIAPRVQEKEETEASPKPWTPRR